jgi:hypothetical protein
MNYDWLIIKCSYDKLDKLEQNWTQIQIKHLHWKAMKLTPELIERSLSYINAVKDRELDLRGIL